MGFFNAYSRFLAIFDFYGQPVRMRYELTTTFKSVMGGTISLMMYTIFIAIIIYLFNDLNQKNNYNLTTNNLMFDDPPRFNFSSDEKNTNVSYFFYAIQVVDKNTGKVMTKLEIEKIFFLEAIDTRLNKSSGIFNTMGIYEFISCTTMFPNKNLTNILKNKNLDTSLCLNTTDYTVEGQFTSNFYRFMSFKIKDCSSSILKSKPTCGSKTESNDAKKNWNIIFYYTDYQINPLIHIGSPVYYVINSFNVDLTSLIYQKFDIYLGFNRLNSFDNIYNTFIDSTNQNIIGINKVVKNHSNPNRSLVAFYLRSDYNYILYVRTYKTFIDYLSQIGGIWKVVYLLGAFIIVPINAKLLRVAISNDVFNLIHPNRTEKVEKETYEYLAKRTTSQNPNKIIDAYGKNPLECKMAINYYRYERHKGMSFTVKEAFYDTFFMYCKSQSMITEEKIFLEAEDRLYKLLNMSMILNFSKQYQIMKKVLLGNKSKMIEFSHKNTIHINKIEYLKKMFKKYLEYKEFHPIDLALIKENYFISGLRGLKNKLGGLHEKVDVNLLSQFKFEKKQMGRYFIAHLEALELKYPGITFIVSQKEEED